MGKEAIRILKFAIRFDGCWHYYGKDRKIVRAIGTLESLGFIKVNRSTQQFTLNR